MDVTVVGAGVVGLTTALVLERAGHRVQVVAAASGDATTSSVAGALWLPYRCGPADRVAVWAAATRAWLVELAARAPEAGVDVLTAYEITAADEPPWWCAAAPDVSRAPAPVAGAPIAWTFAAPRVDPPVHLAWLAAQLARPIERRAVVDLAAEPGDAVINCTGLGARALCADDELVPLLGQVVVVEPGAIDLSISLGDDRDPAGIFYAIPRRGQVVLGGCSLPWTSADPPPADPAITARILAHAARLGLAPGRVLSTPVGLRPFRSEVRLERDAHAPRIVHDYGHGGAGFTLAHGCALDVAFLLAPPSISHPDISRLLDAELATHDLRARLAPYLRTPTPILLTWQYGADDDLFPAWLVAVSPDVRVGLVYCVQGLGATFPWGVVMLADRDMGMDSEWHGNLLDAAIHAGLLPAPPGHVVGRPA